MNLFVLLILAVFASEEKENVENGCKNKDKIGSNQLIIVKIEEDKYEIVSKKSEYIGVTYSKNLSKWCARRWSKNKKKHFSNGYYDDEKTAAHASDTLARGLMINGKEIHKLNYPDDQIEVFPAEKSSKFIGVTYDKKTLKWRVQRLSKYENKHIYYGSYDDEKTAAHASDTLARKLMKNGEQKLKLNFPDDETEVYPQEKPSKFIGVYYVKDKLKWKVQRFDKCKNKVFYNGYYDNEETAARASDTLARKLIKNSEDNHKLNFPDDPTEVYKYRAEKSSKFIGVRYCKKLLKWQVQRWSKHKNKVLSNGYYTDEETTALASDKLARKLIENGEQNHKLNFSDDHTKVYPEENQKKKRKRPKDFCLDFLENN